MIPLRANEIYFILCSSILYSRIYRWNRYESVINRRTFISFVFFHDYFCYFFYRLYASADILNLSLTE